MPRRIRVRVSALLVLIALLMGLFTIRIYKLQSSMTEEAIQEANSIYYYTTVPAARGQILDRNGTVLVTNRASYNLTLIGYVLFNGPTPNESILELVRTCRELGIEIEHHLPVSETRPYQYTLDELGEPWTTYFRWFLTKRSIDSDVNAGTFMNNLRRSYNLPEDLTDEEAYLVTAIRYELALRDKDMPLDNYVLARDVTAAQLAAIMELSIPGLVVETSTIREYKTKYAAHLLGQTGQMDADEYQNTYKAQGYAMNAIVGKEGVELAFEQYLHGQDGRMKTLVTSTGEILDQEYVVTPVPGGNVELSIDLNLQMVAENALEEKILYLRENGVNEKGDGADAKGGAVVVMDVKTGEVLASASYPTYDLSTYRQNYNALAADETYKPLINRVLNAQYEPGSIYKMVTAITAMEYANVSRYFQVRDEGAYTKYQDEGYAPACHIFRSKGYTHGLENMMDALRDSCNYYFYEVGLRCSIDDMDTVASKLGLGEPTGAELIEYAGRRANRETKGQVWAGTNQAAWVNGDMLQASIGQSLNQFTPLQMCVYTSTLANQGVRYKATFLRRVVSWDFQELLLESQPEVMDTLELSDETKAMLYEGMTAAAGINGTAGKFAGYSVKVAAKTGTAQHGDLSESDNASLVCYAPADDPRIAIAIYVENGAQGGQLADIAIKIMDTYFSQTGKYETVYGENEVR